MLPYVRLKICYARLLPHTKCPPTPTLCLHLKKERPLATGKSQKTELKQNQKSANQKSDSPAVAMAYDKCQMPHQLLRKRSSYAYSAPSFHFQLNSSLSYYSA